MLQPAEMKEIFKRSIDTSSFPGRREKRSSQRKALSSRVFISSSLRLRGERSFANTANVSRNTESITFSRLTELSLGESLTQEKDPWAARPRCCGPHLFARAVVTEARFLFIQGSGSRA